MKESKKKEILENLYVYCAMNGFNHIDNISQLSKALSVSRPLFYFYFKSSELLFEELMQYHCQKIDQALKYVEEHELDFRGYVYNLVDVKDLYFYTLRCINKSLEDKSYQPATQYSLSTLDQYSYKQFLTYYQLEKIPGEQSKLLYDSLRNFCFLNSGDYADWSKKTVDTLMSKIEAMLSLISKEITVPST